jgi:hypothetical protein
MNERTTSFQAARVSNERRETKTWNAHELGDAKRKKVAKGKEGREKEKKEAKEGGFGGDGLERERQTDALSVRERTSTELLWAVCTLSLCTYSVPTIYQEGKTATVNHLPQTGGSKRNEIRAKTEGSGQSQASKTRAGSDHTNRLGP